MSGREREKADWDLAIEGNRLVLPINGGYNNADPSLFIIGPCPLPVTVMSAFIAEGAENGGLGPLPSTTILVLVRKHGAHQKENHGGISLRCINIHYPPQSPSL